jgi:hypothetical protein
MPLYPSIVLEVGSALQVPYFRNTTHLDPQVGSTRDLGVRHFYPQSAASQGACPLLFTLSLFLLHTHI